VRVRMGERLRMTAVWRMGRGGFLGWGAGAAVAAATSTSVARLRRKIGLPDIKESNEYVRSVARSIFQGLTGCSEQDGHGRRAGPVPKTDHTHGVAAVHRHISHDAQSRLKLISRREHRKDTRKASALGCALVDTTISLHCINVHLD
jgi:hypothetical protein